MNNREIRDKSNNADFKIFLDLISSFPREEAIMAIFRLFKSMRPDLLEANGIDFATDELDFAVKHQYSGMRLEFAQNGLAQKLKYLVGVCIYGEQEQENVAAVFADIRRILIGKLHLVNFVIEDPAQAAEISNTLATLRKMSAHKELRTALGLGESDKDKNEPLS